MASMKDLKKKIIENKWSSGSPKFSSDDLKLILKHEEQCVCCGENIFDLDDFPEIRDGDLLCMDCYDDRYRTMCPLCEEWYEKNENDEGSFPKSPFFYFIENDPKNGVYEALDYPIFVSDYFSAVIQWDSVRKICEVSDICRNTDKGAEYICGNCWEKAKTARAKNREILFRTFVDICR